MKGYCCKSCFGCASSCRAPESVPSVLISSTCTADTDCSLNGVCSKAGNCVCDKPWIGESCDVLDVAEVSIPQGYGMVPNITTWGGGIIKGDDGKYHMFVSRMTNGCPLNTWTQIPELDHAVSPQSKVPINFQTLLSIPGLIMRLLSSCVTVRLR